jgi:hypothetical protein
MHGRTTIKIKSLQVLHIAHDMEIYRNDHNSSQFRNNRQQSQKDVF